MADSIVLGIMVCKTANLFYEKEFYKFLQKFGKEKNLFVYVFYPDYINWKTKKVQGFQFNFNSNTWFSDRFPTPDFVYDRCFYTSSKIYLKYKTYVEQIKQNKKIRFLGYGLKGKMEVYRILSTNPQLVKYLPETERLTNTQQFINWLNKSPVILKPTGGSHGAGVIKVSKEKSKYLAVGRDVKNNKIMIPFDNLANLTTWLSNIFKEKKYLIQEYLDLNTSNNKPFDIRVVIQKNNLGDWETIGMVARLGDTGNITSNLHGGGTVQEVTSLLNQEFGEENAEQIKNEITFLANTIPPYLESSHGELFEIGLDLGVDRKGRVWIIEVNSKPGRKVFSLLNDREKRIKSLVQPIYYTEYLSKLNRRK